MKLGLGTVQFGIDYGISNELGKVSGAEIDEILKYAAESSILTLDTASLYGDSERVIGQSLRNIGLQFEVVTKTPEFQSSIISKDDVEHLEEIFQRSLCGLGVNSVNGLLIHHAADLMKPSGQTLIEKMLEFKEHKKVKNIGVSVYTGEDIDQILEIFTPDIIQLPVNVFDQRLIASGHLRELKRLGVEIHVRSVFLQGLLLMGLEDVPVYFAPIIKHLQEYHDFLETAGLSKLQGALKFVSQLDEVDVAVIGINSKEQLAEIVQANSSLLDKVENMDPFAIANDNMINPSKWEFA